MNRQELDTLIQNLRCSKCNDYLICPPIIQLKNGTSVCGNCTPPFPPTSPDGTLVRQLALEHILRNLPFPCLFKSEGCEERLFFGCENHKKEDCVHRPLACPTGRCPWTGSMFGIQRHFAEAHSAKIRNVLDFKLLVDKSSEETIFTVIDRVPLLAKYNYKAEQCELTFTVNCLTQDEASYKIWIFNDLIKDYGVSIQREKCFPYTSLTCKNVTLNLKKYLLALENAECVLVSVEMMIEKGDENEVAAPQGRAIIPAPTVNGKIVNCKRPFIPLMTVPQLYTINKSPGPANPRMPR